MDILKKHLGRWNYGGKFSSTPLFIVLHHTGQQSTNQALWTYFNRANSYVSAHYSVDAQGVIWELVPETHQAWHAGLSQWWSYTDLNRYSIGIEVISDWKEFTDEQKYETAKLVQHLANKFDIPKENVVRHADITQYDIQAKESKILAPNNDEYNMKNGRKWDAGINFFDGDYKKYRDELFVDSVEERVNSFADKYGIKGRSKTDTYNQFEVLSILSLMDEN